MLSEVLSGLLPYIGVIAVMLFCRRHPAQLRQFACWGSLFAAAFGYCFMLLHQWIPLIEGGQNAIDIRDWQSVYPHLYMLFRLGWRLSRPPPRAHEIFELVFPGHGAPQLAL
jgi:hypothetical protein